MDKELNELHDLARNMLIDVQRQLQAKQPVPGFSQSDLKRVKKALSNLDMDYQAYGDIMSNNISNPKNLMKAIRNGESAVMKAWQLLPEDTIHHLVQQRTGGDFSTKVSGEMIREVVDRLQDRFQMRFSQSTGPSGVIRGDTALSNAAHKSDDTAKGRERKAIMPNTDRSTTAHRFGTGGYAKEFTPDELATVDALEEAFATRIDAQLQDLDVGIKTDAPRVQAIRQIPGLERAYMPDNTLEEITSMKGIVKNVPDELILDSYRRLQFGQGSVNLRNLSVLPALPLAVGLTQAGTQAVQGDLQAAAGTAFDAAIGEIPIVGDVAQPDPVADGTIEPFGSADARTQYELENRGQPLPPFVPEAPVDSKAVQTRQELEQNAAIARERGSRMKFQLGSVSIGLPELGLSELLGMNK